MADSVPCPQSGWYDRAQEQVYILLESRADGNTARKCVVWFLAALILINVGVVILETKQDLYLAYEPVFAATDLFTVAVFSVEYVLRAWVCVRNPAYSSPVKGRIRYLLSPLALVDLLAITPFYLPLVMPVELRMLRLLRMLRIFRVLKLGRFSDAFETFADVLRSKKEELAIAVIMAVIILLLSASALYQLEREVQPEKFGSIPDAMWWAVVTLATVGYGDVYPVTPTGKFISAIVALSAVGLFALPAGVLASGFAESINRRCAPAGKEEVTCPVCGTSFSPEGDGSRPQEPENSRVPPR